MLFAQDGICGAYGERIEAELTSVERLSDRTATPGREACVRAPSGFEISTTETGGLHARESGCAHRFVVGEERRSMK